MSIKLSTIYERLTPMLGRRTESFAQSYPAIARLTIEVQEEEAGTALNSPRLIFTEESFRPVVDCGNPHCYGGGIEIGWMLHDMVQGRQTTLETRKLCEGSEATRSKRQKGCLHRFHLKIQIEFKPAAGILPGKMEFRDTF